MQMFSLTIVDHVRLDSEHVDKNYMVHARSAERIVQAVFVSRIVIIALLAIATAIATTSLLVPGRGFQIATVVATTLALVAFATYAALGLEGRLYAHRSFVHRLWIVSERYRSLLAEVQEGKVEGPALLQRRDELIRDVHAIYEFGFGVDQAGHESVRLTALPDQRAA
jgi:hypothetical protein